MKTMVLLIILACGMVWPTVYNNPHRGGVTVIYKTPGPVVTVSKPRVVQCSI